MSLCLSVCPSSPLTPFPQPIQGQFSGMEDDLQFGSNIGLGSQQIVGAQQFGATVGQQFALPTVTQAPIYAATQAQVRGRARQRSAGQWDH